MKSLSAALLAIALVLASADSQASSTYQIDVAHSGAIDLQQGFKAPLKRRWVRDLGGLVSYPVIAEGFVFVTAGNTRGDASTLYALNLKAGETVWSKPIGSFFSYVAYDAGKIFVADGSGKLQAFAANAGGALLWTLAIGSRAAPTAWNGLVYIDDGRNIVAVDEANGTVRWSAPHEGSGASSPAIGGGGVYVSYWGKYYKFDPATGKRLWFDDQPGSGGQGRDSVYHNGRVYIRDDFRGPVVLDAATGAFVDTLAAVTEPPAFYDFADGAHYEYTLFDGQIYAVDLASGFVAWSFRGDKQIASAPIVVNGVVVVGSAKGHLYLLDGKSGEQLWRHKVGAPVSQEHDTPLPGFSAGAGLLLVPSTNLLSAYVSRP